MTKEKILIIQKITSYAKKFNVKISASSSDENTLCFDLKGARMPKDTFKDEVREFIKIQMQFNIDLKQDVTVLQEDVGVLKKDVADLKDDVKVIKKDVAELQEDVKVIKEDVASLKEDVADLQEDVKVIKKDVAELQEDVKVIKEDVADLQEDVDKLKQKEDN